VKNNQLDFTKKVLINLYRKFIIKKYMIIDFIVLFQLIKPTNVICKYCTYTDIKNIIMNIKNKTVWMTESF
jgi:hypothetical protein